MLSRKDATAKRRLARERSRPIKDKGPGVPSGVSNLVDAWRKRCGVIRSICHAYQTDVTPSIITLITLKDDVMDPSNDDIFAWIDQYCHVYAGNLRPPYNLISALKWTLWKQIRKRPPCPALVAVNKHHGRVSIYRRLMRVIPCRGVSHLITLYVI